LGSAKPSASLGESVARALSSPSSLFVPIPWRRGGRQGSDQLPRGAVTSSTARLNAASFARDGRFAPLSLRTN
jgi:hypothetical protein